MNDKRFRRGCNVVKCLGNVQVSAVRSNGGPTHAPRPARSARGWWLPLALLLALAACAAPISVTRVDPQIVQQ